MTNHPIHLFALIVYENVERRVSDKRKPASIGLKIHPHRPHLRRDFLCRSRPVTEVTVTWMCHGVSSPCWLVSMYYWSDYERCRLTTNRNITTHPGCSAIHYTRKLRSILLRTYDQFYSEITTCFSNRNLAYNWLFSSVVCIFDMTYALGSWCLEKYCLKRR